MPEMFMLQIAMPAMPLGSIVRPMSNLPILIYLPPKPAMCPIIMWYHDEEWTREQVCYQQLQQTAYRWNAFSPQQQEATVGAELVEYQCALFCYEHVTDLMAYAIERMS
jgi:hypothetical protein